MSPRNIAERRFMAVDVETGSVLRELCNRREIPIIEDEVCPDHIHMLPEIPPKYSISQIMGCFKGTSSPLIYEQWRKARYKYRGKQFWCRGDYFDTTEKNAQKMVEYTATIKRRRGGQSVNDGLALFMVSQVIHARTGSDALFRRGWQDEPY